MNQHILISGATGMLGRHLIDTLLQLGYKVSILSRKPQRINHVQVYLWDVKKREIDPACLSGVDTVIHLAGENISSERWTKRRKKEIIDSRVASMHLLFKIIAEQGNQVKNFITAAAVGYYGDRGDEVLTERSQPGEGFLAECCKLWEKAADQGEALGIRMVKIRTGVALSKESGALAAMAVPVKFFAGAPLGTGRQWIPWIHYQDMTNIYLHLISSPHLQGTYNAAAPCPVTNNTFTKALAKTLHRPVWPFSIPTVMMKLIMGEMSEIVLNSTKTSVQKLLDTGFVFKYNQLEDALSEIYRA